MNIFAMECDEEALRVKTEDDRSFNFSTSPDEIDLTAPKKPKSLRDPLSHRIIEKRRRDRMNNSLADLSRLIPTNYLKQGQGRIEKTEIIEMAIKHIKSLTNMANKHGGLTSGLPDRYIGFKECQEEVMRYLVEVEGWDAMDQLCNRMIAHLQQAGETFQAMNKDSPTNENGIENKKEDNYSMEDSNCNLESAKMTEYNKNMTDRRGMCMMDQSPSMEGGFSIPKVTEEQQQFNANLQGYFQGSNPTQVTQEHLRRDKHLWTLLHAQYGPTGSMMEGGSGISTGSGSCITETDISCIPYEPEKLSERNSGTDLDTASLTTAAKKEQAYKFKHNITKRFSQEENLVRQSDTSSNSSQEENKTKRKFRCKSQSPCSSGSSPYPNSSVSDSSNGNLSSSSSSSGASQSHLPGFVLHPSGTHYIPFSINRLNVGNKVCEEKPSLGTCVFHPISIPVNFDGPLLKMNTFNVNLSGSPKAMTEDGSCRSSDSSPTPAEEQTKSP